MNTFSYNIHSVKDCINETEAQLRDLISTILSLKYGYNWESNPSGLSPKVLEKLTQKKQEEEKKFPHQKVSDRFIDYSDITNLKEPIANNWNDFSSIFLSKDKILLYLDELQKLRNPEMHARPELLPHQKHLALGICGEIMLAIENWHKGFTHKPKSYLVWLQFPVYPTNGGEEEAQVQARTRAEEWLEKVKGSLGAQFDKKESITEHTSGLLRTPHGHVKSKLSWRYRGFDGSSYFRAADVFLETQSLKALDEVIKAGDHPYWSIRYVLQTDLDLSIIYNRTQELTGRSPSSSGSIKYGDGPTILTNIEYTLLPRLRLSLERGHSAGGSISLTYDLAHTKKGFMKAHEIFPPQRLLSILYGEVTPAMVKQLLDEGCSP